MESDSTDCKCAVAVRPCPYCAHRDECWVEDPEVVGLAGRSFEQPPAELGDAWATSSWEEGGVL